MGLPLALVSSMLEGAESRLRKNVAAGVAR